MSVCRISRVLKLPVASGLEIVDRNTFLCVCERRDQRQRSSSCPPRLEQQQPEDMPVAQKVFREGATSIMISKVAKELSGEQFMTVLDNMGFAGTYDVVVMPKDRKTRVRIGICFVNFLTVGEAARFCLRGGLGAETQLSIAHQQGKEETLSHIFTSTRLKRSPKTLDLFVSGPKGMEKVVLTKPRK